MTFTQADGNGVSRRRSLLIAPFLAFVAVGGLLLYALRTGDPSTLPSALIGKPVPAFTLPGVESLLADGRPVPGLSQADLTKGQVSIVNVWASWCGPCRTEHPFLDELKAKAVAAMYGINYKDQAVNARRFLGRYGNPFSAVGADTTGRVAIDWGVYGVPETYIVNGKGEIVYRHVGPISRAVVDKILLPKIEMAKGG